MSVENRIGLLILGFLWLALGLALIIRRRSVADLRSSRIESMSDRDQKIARWQMLKPRSSEWRPFLEKTLPLVAAPFLIVGGLLIGSGAGAW